MAVYILGFYSLLDMKYVTVVVATSIKVGKLRATLAWRQETANKPSSGQAGSGGTASKPSSGQAKMLIDV